MTEYKKGDWVLIRAKVLEGPDVDGDYRVELATPDRFAYPAPEDIVGPALTPEPDHDCIVIDREGDTWRWEDDGHWHVANRSVRLPWNLIASDFGPFRVFREVQ